MKSHKKVNLVHELLTVDLLGSYLNKEYINNLNNFRYKSKKTNKLCNRNRRIQLLKMHDFRLWDNEETKNYFKQSCRINRLKLLARVINK